MSFAQAIREVSCEGLAPAAQQSVLSWFSVNWNREGKA
jgi:hypothetical protein